MHRPVLALALLVALAALPLAHSAPYCQPGQAPRFGLGFAALKQQLGPVMGEPTTCEFADPNGTGDTLQQTSTGLSLWRKSTNTPTFTDGFEHWALTPRGIVSWTGDDIDPPADARPVPLRDRLPIESAAGERNPGASGGRAASSLPTPDPALEAELRAVLGARVGHYGVVVAELASGTGAFVHPDRDFGTASLFKLGLMLEAFRQRDLEQLSFSERLTITPRAAAWDLGTLQSWATVGQRVTIRQLLEQMITISDNTAAILLGNHLGWQRAEQTLRTLGLGATRIATRTPTTTARDMAILLHAIAEGRAVSPHASAEMQALLRRQQIRDRIPAGVPRGVVVGNKTANLPHATHDVAIVYAPSGTYVLAVLSDLPWAPDPIVALSRHVYQYYHPPSP